MYGLSVRWSLADAPADVDQELRAYVRDSSLERFTGMPGLRFKTWRMRSGEWFEGTYVFATEAERDEFSSDFAAKAPDSPVSKLIGSAPAEQETFEVVAVAEGGAGFVAGPGPASQ